ncbi:MAG TPA: sugar ABC transporter permease [Intrasporangium sp.]|uniref:carbohydrate ABC transporter permease n=1 Tax=Intrasporangium sp. TaxID=1925024 RepID=UPI002D79E535|nr:sugar ABC transporter permease [Intrasporangium sp.]HET7398734.1 sugar ABC transporter permease [Intrasporangium sp.]
MSAQSSHRTATRDRLLPSRRRRRTTAPRRRDGRLAFWLVIPSLAVLTAVIGYPIVQGVGRSLFDDSVSESLRFVGGDNYAQALWGANRAEFWAAFRVTWFFTITTVVLETLIGLAMALFMNQAFRGRGLMRASVLVPWAIPTAVAAVLWRWAFDPRGIINALFGTSITWTGSEWPSKVAIVFADTWKTAPFVALLILAGLQIIPGEVFEAAAMDGAGPVKRFLHITLPLVRPSLLVAVLFRMLDALRMYDLPAIFTNGANDTTTLSILVVRASLGNLQAGYGGALSTLTFLIIFAAAFLFVKLLGANVVNRDTEV